VDSEVPDDRDYLAELKQGLSILFNDNAVNYELKQNYNSKAPPPRGYVKTNYQLIIHVDFSISNMLKGIDLDLRKFKVGPYSPNSTSTTQNLQKACMVFRVDYTIDNLNHFIDELNKKTWENYSTEFSKELEKKLDDGSKE